MFGHTEVIDKKNVVEVPLDPRAWMSAEQFVLHVAKRTKNTIVFTASDVTKLPAIPSTAIGRMISRVGGDRVHIAYKVPPISRPCDVLTLSQVKAFADGTGVTIFVNSVNHCTESADFIIVKGTIQEADTPWLGVTTTSILRNGFMRDNQDF